MTPMYCTSSAVTRRDEVHLFVPTGEPRAVSPTGARDQDHRRVLMHENATRPTSVYRYYDEFDFLLYAGVTSRGQSRNVEHVRRAEWWPYVARQEVEHYGSRPEALARETELIRTHHPPFNKQQNEAPLGRQAYERLRCEMDTGETFDQQCQRLSGRISLSPIDFIPGSGAASLMAAPCDWRVAKHLQLPTGEQVKVHLGGGRHGHVNGIRTIGPMFVLDLQLHRRVQAIRGGWVRYSRLTRKLGRYDLTVNLVYLDGKVGNKKNWRAGQMDGAV